MREHEANLGHEESKSALVDMGSGGEELPPWDHADRKSLKN